MSQKHNRSLGHIELTEKQAAFHKIMKNPRTRVILLSGPAGTAKTFLSVYTGLYKYYENSLIDILYLRNLTESAEKGMGFLKGTLDDKFGPYMGPLEDKLEELLLPAEKKHMELKQVIQAAPINFMRGATWRNKTVIVDEAQNMTVKELITIVTRISTNTTLFICGDTMQSDIKATGFEKFCKVFNDEESRSHGVYHLEFTKDDVMRDEIIGFLVEKIEKSNLK